MLFLVVLAAVCSAKLELLGVEQKDAFENEFIVVFKKHTSQDQVDSHLETMSAHEDIVIKKGPWNIADGLFQGYYAHINKDSDGMELLRNNEDASIDYIEANREMHAFRTKRHKKRKHRKRPIHNLQSKVVTPFAKDGEKICQTQLEATWGLVRTTQKISRLDGVYAHKAEDGEHVYAYVLDTGIYLDHVEFDGRAIWGYDAVNSPSPETDNNGHGTHVAGTIGSGAWGIAKSVVPVAVQVLGSSGSGSYAGVIDGINWAANDCKSKTSCVGNLSLGGGKSLSVNAAVDASWEAGIVMVCASGNESQDACNVSPASAEKCLTANCSDSDDAFCWFSNYGSCTDIIAPGMSITSCWIDGRYSDATLSGTSMSAPHVAGVAAKILSEGSSNLTPDDVKRLLSEMSTKNMITTLPDNGQNTANELVFFACE